MMHERHPLTGREVTTRSAIPLNIRPAADAARFSLRIDPAEASAASKALGMALPEKIGGVSASGELCAICLGPDEWHVIVPLAHGHALESRFADLYGTVIHSLVDIGHREVGIEIEGAAAALVLQSAIAFDVGAMPVGSGCRTIFDRAQIVLLRVAEDRFRIEVWQSFADHVWGLLQAASREVELDI